MKTLQTAKNVDIIVYLQEALKNTYEKLNDPTFSIEVVRGQIIALTKMLRQFGYEYELMIDLVEVKN